MHNDDKPIGSVVTRREVIGLLGAAGGAWLGLGSRASAGESGCVVRPAQTDGPYLVDEMLDRLDLHRDPTDGRVQPGFEFTSQLYFEDALPDQVLAAAPHAARGPRYGMLVCGS